MTQIQSVERKQILTDVSAEEVGEHFHTEGQNVIQALVVADNVTTGATIKFYGTDQDVGADFESAPGANNPYIELGFYNLSDASFTDGATGLAISGSGVWIVSLNCDEMFEVTAAVTGYTDGTYSCKMLAK